MFRVLVKTFAALLLSVALGGQSGAQFLDPLGSWNAGAAKRAITDFVAAVTTAGSPDFVAPADRIAVFDNDGTLWPEQPMYVQLAFALDRVRALAPQHPEWKTTQPFEAAIEGDFKTLAAAGEKGIVELAMASHAGMSSAEFTKIVESWLAEARHPKFKRAYTDLSYKPMLEVLGYLRANGFSTYIVSGGGVEFMRPWSDKVYGVRPEQVIGSSIKTRFEMRGGRPELFRLPEVDSVNDGPGKPVGINAHIGGRPIAAFGNSDGDLQMLQWATMSGRRGLGVVVHHTDAAREFAYDRDSSFGRLDTVLDIASDNGWAVVDMKEDWNRLFSFQP